MKRHVTIAVVVLGLAAYSVGEASHSDSQESQSQMATPPSAKLSKKDRKRLEKEEKKERKQDRKEEKHLEQKQAKEERNQDKKQQEQVAKERRRELKEEEKQVAAERKSKEKYERKEAERAEKQDAREMNQHIEREARAERAAAAKSAPRYVYVPRIPVSTTATPGLLVAQREVSRAIYSQLPSSNVRVLLDGGSQIVLRGSAPTPSLRQRLLQLAVGAARGYSVVDQLAAQFVGDAASAATSAAIGGVSDLIHGSGAKNSSRASGPEPSLDPAAQPPVSSQPALPQSDVDALAGVLEPGSNACVNVHNFSQVLLTGGLASQSSAELIRRFAHQLSSPSAVVTDQLAVAGSPAGAGVAAAGMQVGTADVHSAGNARQDGASTSDTGITASANSPPTPLSRGSTLSPGSTVCVTENNSELFLTGTVGSPADLGTVQDAVQPLVGNRRLLDHLTIAGLNSRTEPPTVAGSPAAADAAADEVLVTGDAVAGNTPPPVQQNEVEQALHSIPRLANVNVQVAADGVHLSGLVDTTQDDQMAAELARQYAPGRPVLDKVAVTNRTPPPRE